MEATRQVVAERQLLAMQALAFVHLPQVEQRKMLLQLRVEADPEYLKRLRPDAGA